MPRHEVDAAYGEKQNMKPALFEDWRIAQPLKENLA